MSHPAIDHLLRFFAFEHLPAGPLRDTSAQFCNLAHAMAESLPDSPEKAATLRKLLEAKDCAVRSCLPMPKEQQP